MNSLNAVFGARFGASILFRRSHRQLGLRAAPHNDLCVGGAHTPRRNTFGFPVHFLTLDYFSCGARAGPRVRANTAAALELFCTKNRSPPIRLSNATITKSKSPNAIPFSEPTPIN